MLLKERRTLLPFDRSIHRCHDDLVATEVALSIGVLLGYDMQAACQQTFATISAMVSTKIKHWAARGVPFLGRVHVAKQVLAAALWYHASFQRPPKALLTQLSSQLRRFVASAQQPSHSDDAVALAQGNSQGSAQLPCVPSGAALFPGELASSLPLTHGDVGLVHVVEIWEHLGEFSHCCDT